MMAIYLNLQSAVMYLRQRLPLGSAGRPSPPFQLAV
jgi:hypothetical protein